MARLDDEQREDLTAATVRVVLDLRRQYLAGGANPLPHWEQIANRIRSAARRTTGPAEWISAVMRSLQIASPSSALALSVAALERTVTSRGGSAAWLDLVEREHGAIMAHARLEAERRRSEYETEGER